MKPHHSRKIPTETQLKLWVKSGGWCEFTGCDEYLLKDHLTLKETNYSNIAHIVAYSKDGPRGNDPLPTPLRNKFQNLMLVCMKHHKTIDAHKFVKDYPTRTLHQFKKEHEDRIYRQAQYKPNCKTMVLRLVSNVGDYKSSIQMADIYDAIKPKYPEDDKGIDIDLTQMPGLDNAQYWNTGASVIRQQVIEALRSGINTRDIAHISVFAIAPIPFLIQLGSCLSDKIPTDIYQRHRFGKEWRWKLNSGNVKFNVRKIKHGKIKNRIGLILSISGDVPLTDLPKNVTDDLDLYEIRPHKREPSPLLIKTKEDLRAFCEVYISFLRRINKSYRRLQEVNLFPAVPVSVGVACGFHRLRKIDPPMIVYDFDKKNRVFKKTVTVR